MSEQRAPKSESNARRKKSWRSVRVGALAGALLAYLHALSLIPGHFGGRFLYRSSDVDAIWLFLFQNMVAGAIAAGALVRLWQHLAAAPSARDQEPPPPRREPPAPRDE